MNILFLTTGTFHSINEYSLYPDLLREFKKNGHDIYVVSTYERRLGKKTEYIEEDGAHLLRVKIGNLTKTGLIEKGISTLMIESQFKRAIKQYLNNIRFDLILYSTPPITLVSAIKYIKNRDGAKTYLLLKDIFPQNAVDIGLLKTNGLYKFLYFWFKNKEKKLYDISDFIGCMSTANVEYLLSNNQQIDTNIVEVCPNCIDIKDKSVNKLTINEIRSKYDIPLDKFVFIYGGNLGKPQGIPFIIDCLKSCSDLENVFFLIVGNGTEYDKLEKYRNDTNQINFKLMKRIDKEDYDNMVGACDVGLIFLDYRFTIPNFPSRILSYMQAKLPVLACTDSSTDIGKTIENGGFGWWCESNDSLRFKELIKSISQLQLSSYGDKGYEYLCKHYSVDNAYKIIMNNFEGY